MLILIVKVMTFGLITGKRFLLVGNYEQKLKMVMLKKGKSMKLQILIQITKFLSG